MENIETLTTLFSNFMDVSVGSIIDLWESPYSFFIVIIFGLSVIAVFKRLIR